MNESMVVLVRIFCYHKIMLLNVTHLRIHFTR